MLRSRYLVFLGLLFLFTLNSSCNVERPSILSTNADLKITSTLTPALELTSTHSSTDTPTSTPVPSPTNTTTPTITPTPTLQLPINLSNGFPKPSEPIKITNIPGNIRELAYFGSPFVYELRVTSDEKIGFILTSIGVGIYDMINQKLLNFFPAVGCNERYSSCSYANVLSIDRDGKKFSILSNHEIQVWDLNKGLVFSKPIEGSPIYYSAKINAEGTLLAVIGSSSGILPSKLSFFDITKGEEIILPPELIGGGSNFFFSPNGAWFVIWEDGNRGSIWRTVDWSKQRDFSLPLNQKIIGFSQDDQFIIFQNDSHTFIVKTDNWRQIRQIPIKNDKWERTQKLIFSPTSEKMAELHSGVNRSNLKTETVLRVWDVPSGKLENELMLGNEISDFSLSDTGSVTIHRIPDEVCKEIGTNPTDTCLNKIWWSQSRFFLSEDGNEIKIWQNGIKPDRTWIFKTCSILLTKDWSCSESLEIVFINNDGNFFFVNHGKGENEYEIYQKEGGNGTSIGKFISDANIIEPLWISTDRQFLLFNSATTNGFSIKQQSELWNMQSGVRLKQWTGWLYSFDVNLDQNLLALGFMDRRIIHNLQENQEKYNQETGGFSFTPITFNSQGNLLFVIEKSNHLDTGLPIYTYEIRLLDVDTLEDIPVTQISVNDNVLDAITQSPDGHLLAIGTPEGMIHLYDMSSGKEIYSWRAHDRNVTQLKFSADNTFLVSYSVGSQGGGDGMMKVWGIWP